MMDMGIDITSLEDEMQEFNFEKSVKNNLKTQEELDKLTVDESLNDLERAIFIISSGQDSQHISVIRNLPQLLRHWPTECIRKLVPKLKDILHTSNSEIQLAAAEIFVVIIKEELVPFVQYTQHFLRTIITNIDSRDSAVSKAWLDTLITVIQYLPRDTVKRDVLGLAIAKGQLSQKTLSRMTCCSILGALAAKFDPTVLKKDVVHAVKQLCQDVDFEVRACMCNNLYKIAKGLGQDDTKKLILDEILELAGDEEISVREAALDSILNMANIFDADTMRENIIPLMYRFSEQAVSNEDSTMLTVVRNFGRICHLLSDHFNPEQREWFLSCFQYLCSIGCIIADKPSIEDTDSLQETYHSERRRCSRPENVFKDSIGFPRSPSHMQRITPEKQEMYLECRRACAYNMPAMVIFAGNNDFNTELLDQLTFLCHESDWITRKHIAAGFHEVAETLNDQSFLLHGHLITLLREKQSVFVLTALTQNLTQSIHVIFNRGGYGLSDYKPNATSELISALLTALSRLEQQWNSSWRTMQQLVSHMQNLPDVLTSDQIYYKFVPVIFKIIMNNRYLPVKEAAVCTACIFIRHNRKQEQRKEMCNRLVKDLCYGQKYRSRILFFNACYKMMELFSRSFVKEHLFEHVLHLFHDPVPNVRLLLCKILPSLKSLLKLPRDRALHQQLESSVRRMLSSEKDRDVSSAIRFAIFELDRTEVAMESLTQHMFLEEDIYDHKKEEEERMLLEKEERSKSEDGRSLKASNSIASKSSSNTRADKKSKKTSRNSSYSTASSSHKSTKKDKDRNKLQHVTSTQSTPMYMQQKNSATEIDHFDVTRGSSNFVDHKYSDIHAEDNNLSSINKSQSVTNSSTKISTDKHHKSLTNISTSHNKLDRKISSPLSTSSNSPKPHRGSPIESTKTRRSSLGNSTVNSINSKQTTKSSYNISSSKPNIRRKNSQPAAVGSRKVDRNGHAR